SFAPAHAQQPALAALQVATDFPGGSGKVLSIDHAEQFVRLIPTAHEGRGWVCWWYVRINNVRMGESLTVEVGDAPWATPDRAAWSSDGQTWRQTPPGTRDGKRIRYTWRPESSIVWVAWGPPFTSADAEIAIAEATRQCDSAKAFELCRTRDDRPVPGVRFVHESLKESNHLEQTAAEATPYGVWIQARQHAWESGSSWVCRGLLEWLASDEPRAARLRSLADITIVPIMDMDSVAIGAGGKNQIPQDHNRDWTSKPHWPSVAAAMRQIEERDSAGRFDFFIDLHNPGASTKRPFFYLPPRQLTSSLRQRNLDRFLAAARQDITGPLQFTGETQESGPSYDPKWQSISKNWVATHTQDHVVSLTLETAWNTPHSTTEGYRTVGKQLGEAIERYLGTQPRMPAN
ncbi:MAG: hypothetical protein KDA55_23010, partial [Planctomycetales bacterium]|nr:hypothetical protein [Planctomycetales bacterium]